MPAKTDLERVIKERVKPVIDEAMHKFLGITIGELSTDISDKLKKSPILDFVVDATIPFKRAKKLFKRYYLIKLLRSSYGNVSAIARIAGVDRRSIHRLLKELGIHPEKYREDMLKPYTVKQEAVKTMIEGTLDGYKNIINPKKLEAMYKNVVVITDNILKELPEFNLTLKEAEEEFEKAFFKKLLQESRKTAIAAKKTGLRYETLQRKLKALGMKY